MELGRAARSGPTAGAVGAGEQSSALRVSRGHRAGRSSGQVGISGRRRARRLLRALNASSRPPLNNTVSADRHRSFPGRRPCGHSSRNGATARCPARTCGGTARDRSGGDPRYARYRRLPDLKQKRARIARKPSASISGPPARNSERSGPSRGRGQTCGCRRDPRSAAAAPREAAGSRAGPAAGTPGPRSAEPPGGAPRRAVRSAGAERPQCRTGPSIAAPPGAAAAPPPLRPPLRARGPCAPRPAPPRPRGPGHAYPASAARRRDGHPLRAPPGLAP